MYWAFVANLETSSVFPVMILLCFCLCVNHRARQPRQLNSSEVAQQLRAQQEYENLITATQLQGFSRMETGALQPPLKITSYVRGNTLVLNNVDRERGRPLTGVPRGSIEDAHLSMHDPLLRDHSRTPPTYALHLLQEDGVHVSPPQRTYQGYQSPPVRREASFTLR